MTARPSADLRTLVKAEVDAAIRRYFTDTKVKVGAVPASRTALRLGGNLEFGAGGMGTEFLLRGFVKTFGEDGAFTYQDSAGVEQPGQLALGRGGSLWLLSAFYDAATHVLLLQVVPGFYEGAPAVGDTLWFIIPSAVEDDFSGDAITLNFRSTSAPLVDFDRDPVNANFLTSDRLIGVLWVTATSFRLFEALPNFYAARTYARYGLATVSDTTPTEAELLAGFTANSETITFGTVSDNGYVQLADRRPNINYINSRGSFPENQRRLFLADPAEVDVGGNTYYVYRSFVQRSSSSLTNSVWTMRVEL